MRFQSVDSRLCPRASSRQSLAKLPLPSARSYTAPEGRYTGGFHPRRSRPCRSYDKSLQAGKALRASRPSSPVGPRAAGNDASLEAHKPAGINFNGSMEGKLG
jgi:hypothetical protein